MSIPASATADLVLPGGAGSPLPFDPRAEPPARWRTAARRFVRHPAGVLGMAFTVIVAGAAALADVIAPSDPFRSVAAPLLAPSRAHLMGTDNLGRDMLGAVVHAARTSLVVVLGVAAIASVVGVAVGVVAGYRGGWADDLLMRVTDLFQVVPRFFFALLIIALWGAGLGNLIYVLALTSWPTLARVVRSEVLSLREREYVEAARSLGATDLRIVTRHILPGVLPSALVVIALTCSRVIVLEASLSFLGLGDPSVMSWGYLVSNAQRFLRVAWWMSVFPGVAIAVAVLGINLMSDALNDVLTATTGLSARRAVRSHRRTRRYG